MFDLAVIGGGSAGITFAKFGPKLGARIAVIEADRLGGDCTWTGCVPSKTLIHAAQVAHTVRQAAAYGVHTSAAQIDWPAISAHVRAVQQAIYDHADSPTVLERGGATIIKGRARFRDDATLEVDGQIVKARFYCIATGSHPRIPAIEGLAEAGFVSNETVFRMERLPQRLLVIGGGPIACELGQCFQRFGSQVTLVQHGERLLPRDDADLGPALQRCLEAEGMHIHLRSQVTRVQAQDGAKHITLAHHDGSTSSVLVDEILVAAGRVPNVHDLGLDAAGIAYDPQRGIVVDDYLRTSNQRVYACGDVLGRYQFTHMAGAEAGVVLRNALFPGRSKMSYALVPWATFTDPEVAHVGLNEDEARRSYGSALHVYRMPWSENDRAATEQQTAGFTKLLTVGLREKIVGAHIVGHQAGDLIHEIIIAMQAGMPAATLGSTNHIYPTRALTMRMTAQGSLLRWLESRLGQRLLRAYFRFSAR